MNGMPPCVDKEDLLELVEALYEPLTICESYVRPDVPTTNEHIIEVRQRICRNALMRFTGKPTWQEAIEWLCSQGYSLIWWTTLRHAVEDLTGCIHEDFEFELTLHRKGMKE